MTVSADWGRSYCNSACRTSLSAGCSGEAGVEAGVGLAEPVAADGQGLGLGGFAIFGLIVGGVVVVNVGFAIEDLVHGFFSNVV